MQNHADRDEIGGLWVKAQQAGITRRKFLMLLAAGGVTAVLAACTKASPSLNTISSSVPPSSPKPLTTSPTPTTSKPTPIVSTASLSTTTSAAPVTSTPKPSPTINKYGGTFRMLQPDTSVVFGNPMTMIPPGNIYGGFALEGLISNANVPLTYYPCLATSWILAPDKSSYTFNLRKGVKFHDGTDFNAAAVKWNWDLGIAAKHVNFAQVASIDILDEFTVRANLKDWDALTLDGFGRNTGWIISPEAYQKTGGVEWANFNPVGTGPFIFKEYSRSQYCKYVKNPNYWNTGKPYVDAVVVNAVPNMMTQQLSLLNGDNDGSQGVDSVTGENLIKSGKFVAELGAQGNFGLCYNNTDPASIWSDIRMRQALEYAFDKQTISDAIGKGFTHPIWTVIGGLSEYPGNKLPTTPRMYDPAKARQLIKDAGYSNGVKTTMELNARFNNDFVGAVQGALAKVGIEVEVNVIQQAAYSQRQLETIPPNVLRYDRLPGGVFDMVRSLKDQLLTTTVYYKGVKRPDGWDALASEALHQTDPVKVVAGYNKLEQLAYNEVMRVNIFAQQDINIWSKNLRSDEEFIFLRGGINASQAIQSVYFGK